MRLWWFSLAVVFLAASGCKDSTSKDAETKMKHPKSSLRPWTRPNYQPGGGDACLFYIVYGRVDTTAAISRSAYRAEGRHRCFTRAGCWTLGGQISVSMAFHLPSKREWWIFVAGLLSCRRSAG